MIIVVEPDAHKAVLNAFGKDADRTTELPYGRGADGEALAARLRETLRRLAGDGKPEALSFRLHAGGGRFTGPVPVGEDLPGELERLSASFPLHLPAAARLLRLCLRELKGVRQFAFFETSFFAGLPESEKQYPVADEYCRGSGIMKGGFHGVFHGAHAGLSGKKEKVISVVLDRRTTVCAVRGRAPAAVSLGFTPLEGIMSSRSCGDVDPGIVVYLMKEQGLSPYRVDELLKNESGFYGMTGYDLPPDELFKLYGKDPRVTLAFEVYKNQLLKYFGDYIALMGGVDSLVFGGRYVRPLSPLIYRLAKEISFLEMNLAGLPWDLGQEFLRVTSEGSKRHIYINTLREPALIARETRRLLSGKRSRKMPR